MWILACDFAQNRHPACMLCMVSCRPHGTFTARVIYVDTADSGPFGNTSSMVARPFAGNDSEITSNVAVGWAFANVFDFRRHIDCIWSLFLSIARDCSICTMVGESWPGVPAGSFGQKCCWSARCSPRPTNIATPRIVASEMLFIPS